jgi:hypothetical protein
MTYRLYTAHIPDAALGETSPSAQRRIAALAGSEAATPSVAATGLQPGDLRLRGQYRGPLGERLATELRELLTADHIDQAVFYRVAANVPEAAYYSASESAGARVAPQTPAAVDFDGSLVEAGGLGDFRRAVHAGPTDTRQVDHNFGNATVGYIGVPAAAGPVRWLSNDTTAQQPAAPDSTVSAEFGDVELFDIDAAPAAVGDRPYLVYDLPPTNAGDVDTVVFDTYGDAETRTINGTDVFAWQAVYRSGHRFRGEAVIETGRIRTTLAPDADTITAERWDDATGTWSSVSLGTSDWVLDDADLVRPGPGHTRAQLTFRATADTADASQGDRYRLDARYHRGWADVQFAIPGGESGPIPTDLVTLLDPIASDSVVNPAPNRTLLPRSDLRL